jgi:hypothetical protein
MQQVFLLSIPATSDRNDVFQRIEGISGAGKVFDFPIPKKLTVGTLDSLIALSDDLSKVNAQVEVTSINISPFICIVIECREESREAVCRYQRFK